jgi:hypothetical protein
MSVYQVLAEHGYGTLRPPSPSRGTWRPGAAILPCPLPLRRRTNSSEEIQNIGSFYSDFVAVDQRIDDFISQLSPIDQVSSQNVPLVHLAYCLQWCDHPAARHVFVTEYQLSSQVLVRTRVGIRLHWSDSRHKSLSLFRFVFHFVNRTCF